jgi:Kef-type K+ transport system membrane component KefB
MMIFESGMHFDFEQAKTVGPWASAVAVLGTFLPMIGGTALSMAFGFPFMEGLAAGVSLAPTSVGIALKLLHEANALGEYFGQAVMTAAFVDDVLSLIIFNVLFSVGPCMTFATFIPTICGIVFMVVAIIFATKGFPSLIKLMLSKIPETKPDAKVTRHDEVMFMLMFATLVVYAHITYMCGTHLWGCFIAGMSFASEKHAHHIWVKQVKRNTVWFLRTFFACTLAWSIPVDALFSWDAFLKGTLMGIGPCILTKVCCGPFMGDAKWVIGWAMVGRAEFAYFIAIMANSQKLMSDDLFAILVWALIYATIFAPLVFRKVLGKYMSKLNSGKAESAQKPSLVHSATGSLPVLLCAEHDQDSKLQQRVRELELSLASKDAEITQLKVANQLSTVPELPGVEASMAAAADDVGPLGDADSVHCCV